MKKILVFGGSTSTTSINKQLATYTSTLLKDAGVRIIDMNDYEVPIYSTDEEAKEFPKDLVELSEEMKSYDDYIVSLAEHNGSYAAVFKSILDWLSRINRTIFNDKPALLMATSPGGRGGSSVLAGASAYFPHAGASSVETFSFPSFYDTLKKSVKVFENKL